MNATQPKHRVTVHSSDKGIFLFCHSCPWTKEAGKEPTPAKLEKLARVHRHNAREAARKKAQKDKLRSYPLSKAQRKLIKKQADDPNTKRIPAYPSKAIYDERQDPSRVDLPRVQ